MAVFQVSRVTTCFFLCLGKFGGKVMHFMPNNNVILIETFSNGIFTGSLQFFSHACVCECVFILFLFFSSLGVQGDFLLSLFFSSFSVTFSVTKLVTPSVTSIKITYLHLLVSQVDEPLIPILKNVTPFVTLLVTLLVTPFVTLLVTPSVTD